MELLQEQLDATTDYFAKNLPSDIMAVLEDVLNRGIEAHIANKALSVGEQFPDFELPAANGSTFKLSNKLAAGKPIIVSFYRGSWCPYCNLELKKYQDLLAEIQELGANLVAISPQYPEKAQETITKEGLSFEVLTDENNQLAERLGLLFHQNQAILDTFKSLGFDLEQYYGEGKGFVIPIPATFVIDAKCTILFSYVDPNYRFRAEPSRVLEVLKES